MSIVERIGIPDDVPGVDELNCIIHVLDGNHGKNGSKNLSDLG